MFRVEQLEDRRLMAIGAPPVQDWLSQQVVPGAIIAKFTPETTSEQINEVAAGAGLTVSETYSSFGNLVAFHTLPGGMLPAESSVAKAASLWSNPSVIYVEPDMIAAEVARVPNDPLYNPQAPVPPALVGIGGQQWGLHNSGQTILPLNNNNPAFGYAATAGADIDAESAWNASTGSKNVIVAVIDSGIDYNHPDLKANVWRNPGEVPDGIDNDGNGFVDDIRGWNTVNNSNDVFDDNGHGTHVAGIIGAVGDNGIGVTGVNWNVTLLPIKAANAAGALPNTATIGAYNYVLALKAKGVDISVINASYGGQGLGAWNFGAFDLIQTITNAGILFVAAAGNNSLNNDVIPHYPSSYINPNIISVGASDAKEQPAGFTNYGPTSVDIMAPGVDILSTVPSWYTGPDTILQGTGAQRGHYAYFSGTSMASPMVAGAAALIKSMRPDYTASQIRQTLMDSAERIPAYQDVVNIGARLDIGAAVQSLPHATVNGFAFEDMNGDGIFNPSETGIAGAVIYVDANNNHTLDNGEATATTAADGSYSLQVFSTTGVKTIRQAPITNYVQTAGANGFSLNLQANATFDGINFGNRGVPSQITGQVINDLNRNGIADFGEGGASQIIVFADFNGDGKLGIGEPSTKTNSNGNYTLVVNPGTYTIRLSTTPGWEASIIDPTDSLSLGKRTGVVVVSSQITSNINFFVASVIDFGDAPASYNVRPGTSIVDPPSHGILPNFYIGRQNSSIAGVDAELGPLVSANASGDDASLNDELGELGTDVQFLDEIKASTSARVRVNTTTGNNPQGLLQGWIDFNRDGVFSDNERIIHNLRVGNGVYQTSFNVPSTFTVGTTFARFRLGYENDLGPTGAALAGEVVDMEVRVFGPQPLANDDGPFQVEQNSSETAPENTFDILVNDVQSLTARPQIAFSGATPLIGATPSSLGILTTARGGTLYYFDNGTPNDRTDDKVRYRPPVGQFGDDEFYYRVTDGTNVGNIARVAIKILPANPIARDDVFTISSQSTIIDVLANDLARGQFQTGGPNVTIVGTPTLPAGAPGTLTKLAKGATGNPTNNQPGGGHDVLVYNRGASTAAANFEFTYQLNDALNPVANPPSAKVTMQVLDSTQSPNLVPATAQVRVRAEVSKSNVTPGETVDVRLYVQDLRRPLDPADNSGVVSVGLDLLYDPIFASPNLKPDGSVDITYGPGFLADPDSGNLTDPFIIAPGLIDEIAAVYIGNVALLDGREQLLATIRFEVRDPGAAPRPPASNTTQFIVDPADEPDHEVFVYDSTTTAVEVPTSNVYYTGIYYDIDLPVGPINTPEDRSDMTVSATLVAGGEGEYTNPRVAQDVNNDQTIDLQDALTVIKSTRAIGAQPLQTVSFQAAVANNVPTAFVDVNRDGKLNVLDAISVIRYLRSPRDPYANLEGRSTGFFTTAGSGAQSGSGSQSGSGTQSGSGAESGGATLSSLAADYLFATESFGSKKKSAADAVLDDNSENA
jgi:subtilisin family serine protease